MESYKEWEKTVETEFTCEFSRDGIRDVYCFPNGIRVHHEVFLPSNPFKSQSEQTLVDILYHKSKVEWLKKQGVDYFDQERYSDEDHGYAMFQGENSLERAYNFAMSLNLKKGLLKIH